MSVIGNVQFALEVGTMPDCLPGIEEGTCGKVASGADLRPSAKVAEVLPDLKLRVSHFYLIRTDGNIPCDRGGIGGSH